jgi:hypothetical protein
MFVMINGMRWSELRADELNGDSKTAAKAKLFLIFSIFVAAASVIGAAVLYVRVCAAPCVVLVAVVGLELWPRPH